MIEYRLSEHGSFARLSGAHCLVTGGAGAIGSNLVRALLQLNSRVTVLDNLSSGYATNLDGLQGDFSLVRGDVNSDVDLERAFAQGPEYVFHLAAHFANQNSVDHPLADCMTNANGTIRVLEKCRSISGLCRFVYASSSCVLGHQAGLLTEESPLQADTPYGVSKMSGELYSQIYHRVFGVPTTVVRYFNVFGPGEHPGMYRNVVPNFIHRALNGRSLVITGTGDETREFVFVDDAVIATLLAAVQDAAVGDVFHIGSGEVRSIRQLAEAVVNATGAPVPIQFVARRKWDTIATRQTSFAKAQRMIGYEPQVSFETGLALTTDWIRSLQPNLADAVI